jgi:hypothetical protein
MDEVKELRDNVIASSTKRMYESCSKKLYRWLFDNHPDVCCNEEIMLHRLTADIFHKFLVQLRKKNGEKPGPQTYNSFRATLNYLFRNKNLQIPSDFQIANSNIFKGIKRKFAERKQCGEIPSFEGKRPLPRSVLLYLGKEFLESGDVFSHLYLLMSWNLMCRTINIESIKFIHLDIYEDALAIFFGNMKNDQEGDTLKDARHVYSNPLEPTVCPILSLGLYLLTFSNNFDSLFPGTRQSSRFSNCLTRALNCEKGLSILANSGISSYKEIGTHSIRKGSASFVCSGSLGGPDIASVSNRCGWRLAGVMDRYIKYERAGDFFVGRVVTGLPLNTPDFQILPPRFSKSLSNEVLNDILMKSFPILEKFRNLYGVCRMVLASVIYHREFLKSTMPCNHAIFHSLIFSDVSTYDILAQSVTMDSDGQLPTGI